MQPAMQGQPFTICWKAYGQLVQELNAFNAFNKDKIIVQK